MESPEPETFFMKEISAERRRKRTFSEVDSNNWTGILHFKLVAGKTSPARTYAKYPLKFLLPRKAYKVDCNWVYLLGYGGGLLSNDNINVSICLEEGATVALATQGSTKVYQPKTSLGKSCQTFQAQIKQDAFLAVVPGPVVCFKSARFQQVQEYWLEQNANLLLVDWFTSGRRERGEVWYFDLYQSKTAIYLDGKLLVFDPFTLKPQQQKKHWLMGNINAFATVFLVGKKLESTIESISKKETRKSFKHQQASSTASGEDNSFFTSFSRLENPNQAAAVFRIMAKTTEALLSVLQENLQPVECLLGFHSFTFHRY
eukprot:CAMPEP_0117741254 /NCGR_PEP_ID=MMETSP0947-20121206/4803_1 /TAXON_ID=44440 /ORGANISM="Chattonella subsalsa, Strain CCMP2191" /LENGTH=315 /DNA_ID=CAMNT_0005557475 /DNA_START=175 /DNA_END=1122 /DNA_ORIENTATION=+